MDTNIFAELRRGIVTVEAEETRQIGQRLAEALPADATLALHGDLGVGKTTLVQGLARGFGVDSPVTSPTFTIVTLHRGRRTLVHLDAYRLLGAAQLDALMLDDFLQTPYCLAVEWPENIAGWLPPQTWHLRLSIVEGDRHRIHLQPAP